MKKILVICIVCAILSGSCGKNGGGGELTGVSGRSKYFEPDPFGMVFIPQGSFNMGPSDQDVAWAQNTTTKTVTVEPFWMDETEITNNEYRQFVFWVRDSIMRRILGEQIEDFLISEDAAGNPIDPPMINWDTKIDFEDETVTEAIKELYLDPKERFYYRKEFDTRKLMYEYFWVDLQQASKKSNRYNFSTKQYDGTVVNAAGEPIKIQDRSNFILRETINVYPDTLCWVADFTYSYNEPMANMYFWHPGYDEYPVVGVSWKQATAFCIWRTQYLNGALRRNGDLPVHDYQLPTEAEWEYAARGGLEHSMYPWGGMYTRNKQGCFLANFKPLRGNYADDGGVTTLRVGSYEPNEWGLYDMAGNVAEWCINAFDESGYMFTHDLNPDYIYNARPDDHPAMKRKVIRGGSWKDISYYLQCGVTSYEYQDSTRSYIGFRCIRPYLGSNAK
jgi:formylglycine-generating enzyme required for sulfatase activity